MVQLVDFLVRHPEPESLKETVIGVGVFGRDAGYDPKLDPVVRVEIRRLRGKLLEYYEGSGHADPARLELPKGSYRPQFSTRTQAPIPRKRWPWPTAAALLLILALGTGWWLTNREPILAPASPRLVTAPQQNSRAPVFSADGQQILFSQEEAGYSHIFRLRLNQPDAQAVTSGSVHDQEPAWSPTGAIAFLREVTPGQAYALMLKEAIGGVERELTRLNFRSPMAFTPDGTAILVADRGPEPGPTQLHRIDLKTAQRQRLTNPPAGTPGDTCPRFSPDGQSIAFLRAKEAAVQDVWLMAATGLGPRRLTRENRAIEGLSFTGDGRHLLSSFERGTGVRSLWRISTADGSFQRVAEAGFNPSFPAVSPQGNRLAFAVRIADTNLWRADLHQPGPPRPLTFARLLDTGPQISPDGTKIAYRSTRSGTNEVWLALPDGSQVHRLTSMNGPVTGSARWSPDSSRIVFDSRPANNGDLFLIPSSGGQPEALTREPSNQVLPSWSRDGRSIYYSSDESGDWQVHRMMATGGGREQLTSHGGFAPFESPDGRYFYYVKRSREGGIWRQRVDRSSPEESIAPLAPNFWGQWALGKTGLYYVDFSQQSGPRVIRRLDLITGKTTDIVPLRSLPVQYDSGMSVAPDESWLVWSQLDQAGSDIYVIDGFR